MQVQSTVHLTDSDKLLDYINNRLLGRTGKINSKFINSSTFTSSLEYNQILNCTEFLPVTASLSERLWCVRHNIDTLQLCCICNCPATFLPTIGVGYSRTCSNQSCKSTASSAKSLNTKVQKYGAKVSPNTRVATLSRIENFHTKGAATVLRKYGVDNVSKLSEVKRKKRQSSLLHYGVNHPSKSTEVKAAAIATNTERYGHQYWNKNSALQSQYKLSMYQKYGVHSFTQLHNVEAFAKLSDPLWVRDQYVTNQNTVLAITQFLGLTGNGSTVSRYLKQYSIQTRRIRSFSSKGIEWIKSISVAENIQIQHALSGGEYTIPEHNITVDGYCQSTNTVYEFHGDLFHGNPNLFSRDQHCHPFDRLITAGKLYDNTIAREQKIRSIGYNLVVMWEDDWDNRER